MKRTGLVALACGLAILLIAPVTHAQEKYPDRIIELVIPTGPGGTTDTLGRIYAEEMSRDLKVPINAVNRAGGTGIQGSAYVTRAKKDGYTLLVGSPPWLTYLPIVSNEVPYDPTKEFVPLGHIANVAMVFSVKSDSPFKTLDELVEYARKNPGKIKNSVGGLGTDSHFALEILCFNKNIKITSVPFKSGAESMTALLGGHVDMSSNTIAALGPQVSAGKLRALAISSKTRHPDYPTIPATAELGYPYVNLCPWWGLFAQAGIPQNALSTLTASVEKAFKNPEVNQRVIKAGFTPEYKNPQEFQRFMESERKVIEQVAKSAGLVQK